MRGSKAPRERNTNRTARIVRETSPKAIGGNCGIGLGTIGEFENESAEEKSAVNANAENVYVK